jgi:hypothetical protein
VDAPKQCRTVHLWREAATWCIWLSVALLFWILLFLFILYLGESGDAGIGFINVFLFISPWFQLVRFPLIRLLLGKDRWNEQVRKTAIADWLASLITGAALAVPLASLAVHGGYTGSLLVTSRYNYMLYGQIMLGDYEIGIPDYFVALAFAILVDLLILWGALYRFRKAEFKFGLRIAIIVNAAIYIPVTLLFLMPYFAHKMGG